jgi:hypothetical protein
MRCRRPLNSALTREIRNDPHFPYVEDHPPKLIELFRTAPLGDRRFDFDTARLRDGRGIDPVHIQVELPGPTNLHIYGLLDAARRQELAGTRLTDNETRRASWNPEIANEGSASADFSQALKGTRGSLDETNNVPVTRRDLHRSLDGGEAILLQSRVVLEDQRKGEASFDHHAIDDEVARGAAYFPGAQSMVVEMAQPLRDRASVDGGYPLGAETSARKFLFQPSSPMRVSIQIDVEGGDRKVKHTAPITMFYRALHTAIASRDSPSTDRVINIPCQELKRPMPARGAASACPHLTFARSWPILAPAC